MGVSHRREAERRKRRRGGEESERLGNLILLTLSGTLQQGPIAERCRQIRGKIYRLKGKGGGKLLRKRVVKQGSTRGTLAGTRRLETIIRGSKLEPRLVQGNLQRTERKRFSRH